MNSYSLFTSYALLSADLLVLSDFDGCSAVCRV